MTAAANGVAVAIATYNHARFLGAAIDSVLAQTVPPAEILVVDDGSTDQPEAVVERFPQVRILRQANAGLSAARNSGYRNTSAPLLLFLDADDRLAPNAIETGLKSLATNADAAFTFGAYRIVHALQGRATCPPLRPVPQAAFASFLQGNMIGMHATVLYRREPLQRAGGFAEDLPACEDYEMYLRLARDHPVLCHDDICADYYFHDSNMSRNPGFMLDAALRALGRYRLEAARRGMERDYAAGVAHWKDHYVGAWGRLARQRPAAALRSSLAILRLAPDVVVGKLARRGRRRKGAR
jgi:glycosyltransferase involved in cell wall biosynthesis